MPPTAAAVGGMRHATSSGYQYGCRAPATLPFRRPLPAPRSAHRAQAVEGPLVCEASSKGDAAVKEKARKQQMIDTGAPRGTRDFPPDELRLRKWLFSRFHEASEAFGFEEWDAPVLESEELYVRKAGEEITQQLYNFEDKGNRRVALRPELTPSLARLILQLGSRQPMPAKWYAIGQCWRYERMTRGRRREHYQWNMDIVGVAEVTAEAELLAAVVHFFRSVGIDCDKVGFKVSNRKLLQAVLESYGIVGDQFTQVCIVVDKIDKLPREKIVEELAALNVNEEAVDGILGALTLSSLEEAEKLLGADNEAVLELRQLFQLAEGYGYADWLQFDASVVRGLAYYTGIVFEGFDRAGELRAICGGGRYDRLLATFGGTEQPMCGFGFGDAVIVELLKDNNLLPELSSNIEDIVVALDEDLRPQAVSVASKLRAQGRKVDVVLQAKKMKWVFKQADRVMAKRLFVIGKTEWEKGCIRVKNLDTREEEDVPLDSL
mmetsp:Transcript_7880/g.29189  ORF Transcript_7880/g.29189 Transcript_7880/m.29189 type:complete len:492 (+) Transcript_7880:393-1868(+)